MNYLGDFAVGQEVYVWFNTFDSNDPSASVTMTTFIDTDVHIHKDDSLIQRNNAAGVAVDVDVDGIAGVHKITIQTADNTVADFYEAGHDYAVRIEGATVDAALINPVVGTFSIANRRVAGEMCRSSIEGLTSQTVFTLTSGEASAQDDAYNNCTIIVTDQVTRIQKAIGHISDYTGTTRSVTLAAAPLATGYTMAIGDSVEILATSAFANVDTVLGTLQTAGDIIGDTNDIQARLPASLVSGRIDASVGAMAANVVTAAAINSAALTAAKFGAGAIDANALATDAVNEIRDGLLPTQNATFDNIGVLFVDSTDHVTPVTGATGTSVTRSIDGAAFGAATGTFAEVGNGIYQFDASAADMNGGSITFRFVATGGTPNAPDDVFITIVTGGGV